MVILILILYILVVLLDFMPIYKQRNKKSNLIYIGLIIIAITLSIAIEMGIDIPSPAKPLKNIVSYLIGKE
ncbi:MAG: hypothetical protein CVU84_07955 [Firmicutes bacterium HGW-Firmicutes-1]|nr:MAG: hypothetical protein CVU84_07955 [Firmicutes bacterium HGW-Firmicutes-1]